MSDQTCQECGRENPVWWVDDELWNAAVGTRDNPRGEGIVLCPSCFTRRVIAKIEKITSALALLR